MRTIRLRPVVIASLLAACSSSGLQTPGTPSMGSQDRGNETSGTTLDSSVTDAVGASALTNVTNLCAPVTTNDAGPIDACPCIRAGQDPSGTSCGNVWQTCFYDLPGCTISNCNCEAKDAGAQWVCLSRQC